MAVHFRPDSIMRDCGDGRWFHDNPNADDRMRRRWLSRWMDKAMTLNEAMKGLDLARGGMSDAEALKELGYKVPEKATAEAESA